MLRIDERVKSLASSPRGNDEKRIVNDVGDSPSCSFSNVPAETPTNRKASQSRPAILLSHVRFLDLSIALTLKHCNRIGFLCVKIDRTRFSNGVNINICANSSGTNGTSEITFVQLLNLKFLSRFGTRLVVFIKKCMNIITLDF